MEKNSYQYGLEEEEEEEESETGKAEKSQLPPFLTNFPPLNLKNYQILETIGKGSISNVFKIVDKNTKHLYSAILFDTSQNERSLINKMFSNEITILLQVHHPSIIKYIGYGLVDFEGSPNPIIVTEFYENGSLNDILQKKPIIDGWNETTKMIIVYGIASAMSYLHHLGILHRNLTLHKILVDKNFHPVVSNFDLAIFLKDIENDKNIVGTMLYLAPEVFKESKYSIKSDVYSFAMILYQIFVNTNLYDESHSFNCMNYVISNRRPAFNDDTPYSIKKLIESCWEADPEKRPSFDQIIEILKNDEGLINKNVDKESYLSYIQMIDNEVKNLPQKIDFSFKQKRDQDEMKDEVIEDKIECISCKKKIENKSDALYISGHNYHIDCVKCAICHKKLKSIDQFNSDFIHILPDFFFCKKDYENYLTTKKLPKKVLDEYRDKMIKNMINELFNPMLFKDDELIEESSQKEFFIESDMIENSYLLSKNFKYFVPTVTFHFSFSPNQIKYKEFIELLPEEMVLVNIEKGSTFITIAFIISDELRDTMQIYSQIIEPLKESLNSSLGESIVGNIMDNEPIIEFPDNQKIVEFINHKSINLLQNAEVLNEIDLEEIKNEIREILLQRKNKNFEFIFENFELFEEIENKVRKDIEISDIESIIIGETIIANKHYEKYLQIKEKINEIGEEETNCFLYHGTKLSNQPKIIRNHFLMPGIDMIGPQIDSGYFGKGIYATDNIFYASMYSNGYEILKFNEKISVIGCLGIYSEKHSSQILDATKDGLTLPDDIINFYGIHRALIGSKKNYYPIVENDKNTSFIVANEFVFPNKYQIIPIFSFTVMRTPFYILWADESSHYSSYCDQLKNKLLENIYYVNSLEKTTEIATIKKRNVIKLIISFIHESWAKEVIENVRNVYRSTIVCLIFDDKVNHIDLAASMENVLSTNEVCFLNDFADINMDMDSILSFSDDLEKRYERSFDIDRSSILNFKVFGDFK